MIELFFVACLRILPSECEERSLAYLPEVSTAACILRAPPQLAAWEAAHPGFTIARWSCRDAAAREIKA